uniref:Odorant receptor n=1 Tax=Anopheles darlingi TaxID=43151 RepID=A0A2K6VB07_ANODA
MKFTRSIDLYVVNLNYLRWWADFVGLDITETNYKGNVRTYAALVGVFMLMFGAWYPVWFYWANWIKLMELAAIYAVGIQGMVKFYTVCRYPYFFTNMYARLEQFHREQSDHTKNNASLLRNIHLIRQISRLISLQYLLSCLIYGSIPIAGFLYKREKVLCFSYLIPFTDPDIPWHYFLNVAYQYYLLFVAWAGFSASESVIVLFVASLAGYVDVLKNTVDEMNECLVQVGYGNDRKEVQEKLLEIARLHQRVLE